MRQAKEYSGVAYGARDFILGARPIEVRESIYVVYFQQYKILKSIFLGKEIGEEGKKKPFMFSYFKILAA